MEPGPGLASHARRVLLAGHQVDKFVCLNPLRNQTELRIEAHKETRHDDGFPYSHGGCGLQGLPVGNPLALTGPIVDVPTVFIPS